MHASNRLSIFFKQNVLTYKRHHSTINKNFLFQDASRIGDSRQFYIKEEFDGYLATIGAQYTNKLIYRGTQGASEIRAMVKNQLLGSKYDPFTTDHFHIFSHVIRNESQNWFYSCSEQIGYSRQYTCGHRLIPSHGYIIMMGYPQVFTRPIDVQKLMPEYYSSFCAKIIDRHPDDPVGQSENKFLTEPFIVPELTTILRVNGDMDYSPKVHRDVYGVIDISKSGKIMGLIKDKPYVTVQMIQNANFTVRKACFEILLVNLNLSIKHQDQLNEKARNKKVIKKDHSLITFSQVESITSSSFYKENEYKKAGDMSLPVMIHEVPCNIKDSELVEFYQSKIEEKPNSQTRLKI